MLKHVTESPFLRLNNIPFSVWTVFCLSIHPSISGHLIGRCELCTMNKYMQFSLWVPALALTIFFPPTSICLHLSSCLMEAFSIYLLCPYMGYKFSVLSSSTCGRNWYADAPAPLPLGWNNWTGMSVSTPRVPQWVWIPVIHNNGLLDIAPCTGFLPWLISLLSYFVLSGTTSSKNYIFSNLWFKMCLTGNPN